MTFEAWLRKQFKRNDPVGDLAKDFISSAKMAYRKDRIKIKVLQSLERWHACEEAYDAYKYALREYKKASKKVLCNS